MFTAPAVAPPTAPAVVRSGVIARMPNTLRPGAPVPSSDIGPRTFLGPLFGVALSAVDGVDYPVLSTDGGRVWRINGPALYTDSADAPLAVGPVSAASRSLQFTTGIGGNVVDVTSDGGRVWRRALFTSGSPVAVVPRPVGGGLLAFVQSLGGTISQYETSDGGRTWRRSTASNG